MDLRCHRFPISWWAPSTSINSYNQLYPSQEKQPSKKEIFGVWPDALHSLTENLSHRTFLAQSQRFRVSEVTKEELSRTQPRASFQWLRKTLQSMMATIVEISKQVRTVSPPDLWDGWVGSLSRKPYTMARSCLHLPVHALPDAIHSLTENLLIEPLTIEELFTNATMSIVPMVAKNFAKRDGPDGHHHLKSGSKPAPSPRKAVPNRNVHTIGREAKSGWAQSNKSRRPKFCKEPQGTFVHENPAGM